MTSRDITVAAVVTWARQDDHFRPIARSKTSRGKGHGVSRLVHRHGEITLVGVIDSLVLLGGEDRLHACRVTAASTRQHRKSAQLDGASVSRALRPRPP